MWVCSYWNFLRSGFRALDYEYLELMAWFCILGDGVSNRYFYSVSLNEII